MDNVSLNAQVANSVTLLAIPVINAQLLAVLALDPRSLNVVVAMMDTFFRALLVNQDALLVNTLLQENVTHVIPAA